VIVTSIKLSIFLFVVVVVVVGVEDEFLGGGLPAILFSC
jgi:hypothetical protein